MRWGIAAVLVIGVGLVALPLLQRLMPIEATVEAADGSVYSVADSQTRVLNVGEKLARNQVISFIVSVVICLFLILAGFTPVTDLLVRWANPVFVQTIASFSVMTHFEGFQRGVLDLRDVVFFASVIGFALFTTGVIVRSHRAG